MSLYRTEAGRDAILAYYDKATAAMDAKLEELTLQTRFGETHLLVGGPADGEPVLLFHGGNVVNPVSLSWFLPLMTKYRVYAPDTIGHPGKSAPVSLSGRDNSYAMWAVDLLDQLGLPQANLVGPSFGGGIVLRTAALAPERIKKAVLVVPSSIAMSMWEPIRRIVFPMLIYKLFPTDTWLRRSVQPMFTDPVPAEMLDFVGQVYREVRIHPDMPKTVTAAELADFDAPTLLIAAEHDPFFPAHRVVPRARRVIRNLAGIEVLTGSAHYPSHTGQAFIAARIESFLKEGR